MQYRRTHNASSRHCNGELKLSADTLGAGIYIVRIGTFTAKVTL